MYILECCDKTYYTGSTIDLQKRIIQHQNGQGAKHTRDRLPLRLIYYEEYDKIYKAFIREKQVQGWSREKKEALIKKLPDELRKLAECMNETHFKNHQPLNKGN